MKICYLLTTFEFLLNLQLFSTTKKIMYTGYSERLEKGRREGKGTKKEKG